MDEPVAEWDKDSNLDSNFNFNNNALNVIFYAVSYDEFCKIFYLFFVEITKEGQEQKATNTIDKIWKKVTMKKRLRTTRKNILS